MPRMYCSHIGLLYYPYTFQISPLVSFYAVLAARGGDVYEPSYFSNVPTFDISSLQEIPAAKGETTWARNGRRDLPENARLPSNIQVSFTCRKSTTWDRRLYFPSEGRRAEDCFALKNPTASVGFEPANLGTKRQHATSRPPKPPKVKKFTLWQPTKTLKWSRDIALLFL